MKPAILVLGFIGTLLVGLGSAWASGPDRLPDPRQEARAQELGHEIRCLVCQSQSIEESNADLARDLRRIVRERILAGDDDAAIKKYLTDRYGDFVLFDPPFSGKTLLLWVGPGLALLLGLTIVTRLLRRQKLTEAGNLTPKEQAELDALDRQFQDDGR